MKHFYVVDHFIKFPQSEYGGVWNVIAENDDECFDLIVLDDNESYSEYYGNLRANVIKAQRFALVDNEESRIVERFLT
ncbi:hypothetical protein EBS02_00990 [bacterium]|nr:hypothetical protein [bacterium]